MPRPVLGTAVRATALVTTEWRFVLLCEPLMSQTAPTSLAADQTIVPRAEAATERIQKARKAAGDVVFGQEGVIEREQHLAHLTSSTFDI